jgi:hypothetical protein
MKNLFVVRTPLQLINALEAKYHFKTQNNILIVVYSVNQTDKEQMNKIINEKDWNEIIKLNQKGKKSIFFEYIKLIKKLQKEPVDKLFIVFFKGLQKLFISNIRTKETYLIDDGLASLKIQSELPQLIQRGNLIKELRYRIVGLKTEITKIPDFFTAYNLTS